MSNTFNSFLVVMLISLTASGQTEFGVKGGLNVSDIVMTNFVDPDVEADLQLKTGIHGGIFINTIVDDRIGMAAELLYSDQGVKGLTSIHLHYMCLPLLMQYKLNERFSAELGPEPAYLFMAKSGHGDVSGTYNNKFDLSIDGGFRLDTSKMCFVIRYCAGLFSVRGPFDKLATIGPEKVKYQNRVLQISVGYKFVASE